MRLEVFEEGMKKEDLFEQKLKEVNLNYKRNPWLEEYHPDFLIDEKIIIELTMNITPTKIDALCFHSICNKECGYVTGILIPYEKLTLHRLSFLLRYFDFVLDIDDMNKCIEIILCLVTALRIKFDRFEVATKLYRDYLIKKSQEHPRFERKLMGKATHKLKINLDGI